MLFLKCLFFGGILLPSYLFITASSDWHQLPSSLPSSPDPIHLKSVHQLHLYFSQDDIDPILDDGVSLVVSSITPKPDPNNSKDEPIEDEPNGDENPPKMKMVHGVGKDFSMVKLVTKDDGTLWTGYPPSFPLPKLTYSQSCRLLFSKGFTLLINKVQRRHPFISHLAHTLSSVFYGSTDVSANLYFTPGGGEEGDRRQGFEAHYDWMDVVVFQIEGKKIWTVYDEPGYQLPVWEGEKTKPVPSQMEGGENEYILEPGDVLFLPRGYIHEARNEGEVFQPSLHMTFGIERNGRDFGGHADSSDLTSSRPSFVIEGTVGGFVAWIIREHGFGESAVITNLFELKRSQSPDNTFLRLPFEAANEKHLQFAMLKIHVSLDRGDPEFGETELELTRLMDALREADFEDLRARFEELLRVGREGIYQR